MEGYKIFKDLNYSLVDGRNRLVAEIAIDLNLLNKVPLLRAKKIIEKELEGLHELIMVELEGKLKEWKEE